MMTVRMAIPVFAGESDEPGASLPIAGDTMKILANNAACLIRIREVVDVIRLDDGVVVLDCLVEIKAAGDDSDAK